MHREKKVKLINDANTNSVYYCIHKNECQHFKITPIILSSVNPPVHHSINPCPLSSRITHVNPWAPCLPHLRVSWRRSWRITLYALSLYQRGPYQECSLYQISVARMRWDNSLQSLFGWNCFLYQIEQCTHLWPMCVYTCFHSRRYTS